MVRLDNPSDFNSCQSFFGFSIFPASFSSKCFFSLNFLSRCTSFLASLYISRYMLRRPDLNFLNNLSLKLNFFRYFPIKPLTTCIFYSHSSGGCNFIYHYNKLMRKIVI